LQKEKVLSIKGFWHSWKDTGLMRVIRNKYFLATIIFVVWITFFDSASLISWSRVVMNIGEQEKQKRYYKEAVKSAEEKIDELTSNKDSLEKFAREQYIFKEEDEDIFIVEFE
jgi:cell division protein FtsB